MSKTVITSRPITPTSDAYLLLETDDHSLEPYALQQDQPISITIADPAARYCVGWYDITTHTNHPCEQTRSVDQKYDSCFECRTKTGFNPAFYNTDAISDVQTKYNATPHSVYVSYFGGGLAKAGIMADSRGLERIYEQGALLYCVVGNFNNANSAHHLEARLIQKGLKNSVTKKQKEKALSSVIDTAHEQKIFAAILSDIELKDVTILSNLDHFFFGTYPAPQVEPAGSKPISGSVHGIIGRYLVLQNDDALYGYWLDSLHGHKVEISDGVQPISTGPRQVSLFS